MAIQNYEEKYPPLKKEEYDSPDFILEFMFDYIPEVLKDFQKDLDIINKKFDTNLMLKGRTIYF